MQIQITAEELQKRKLFIATPMYGGMSTGMYTKSIMDLAVMCSKYGIEMRFYALFNESLIPRARNYCCDEFMRSGFTHFLFLDADIGFDPNDVIAMLALQTDESEYDIIGGPYPKKNISWEKIVAAVNKGMADEDPNALDRFVGDFVFNPKGGTSQIPIGEPCEVLEIGTGYMMVRRKTFEKFVEAFPQYSYRPDHVRTEHFDGSREITMFFQAEIDPKSKRYLSEDYWFCTPQKALIETENGQKSIKEIVDSKYSGKVKSLDSDNNIVWKKVTNHIVKRNGKKNQPDSKKKWVKLNTTKDNNTKSKLIVTEEHRVAFFDNIFDPVIDFTEAKNMTGKYCVRNPQKTENVLYSKEQLQFLYGTLLGDGYIHKNGQLLVTHCNEQEEYVDLKAKLFNGTVNNGLQSPKGFKEGTCLNLHTPVNAQLHEIRKIAYIDGVKSVKNILPLLDEKSLAIWYMDDGCYHNHGTIYLSTESFNYEDHLLIKDWFKSKWDIEVVIDDKYVIYKEEKRKYNYIRINKKDGIKLFNLIEKYIIPSMRYKLPSDWVFTDLFNYDGVKSLNFSASFIKNVQYLPKFSSNLYDIEVEDTHNFFANGTLIHNCQKVQELGLKTWLCPWMKTFHVGTMIYGGSLADLASIGASPTADVSQLKKNKKV